MSFLKKVFGHKRGATAIEYALIAGLIAAVVITTVSALGNKSNEKFSSVSNGL